MRQHPRSRLFPRALSPVGTAPVVVQGSATMLMRASKSAKNQTKAAANIREGGLRLASQPLLVPEPNLFTTVQRNHRSRNLTPRVAFSPLRRIMAAT